MKYARSPHTDGIIVRNRRRPFIVDLIVIVPVWTPSVSNLTRGFKATLVYCPRRPCEDTAADRRLNQYDVSMLEHDRRID